MLCAGCGRGWTRMEQWQEWHCAQLRETRLRAQAPNTQRMRTKHTSTHNSDSHFCFPPHAPSAGCTLHILYLTSIQYSSLRETNQHGDPAPRHRHTQVLPGPSRTSSRKRVHPTNLSRPPMPCYRKLALAHFALLQSSSTTTASRGRLTSTKQHMCAHLPPSAYLTI